MRFRLNRAFTLIEILITLAILSTAIIFVFRSFTASLSAARFSQDISLACFLAEDKIWEIEEAAALGLQIPESGTQVIQNKNFNCYHEITDSASPDLRELKFTVSWKENIREKDYPLEFLTYLARLQ